VLSFRTTHAITGELIATADRGSPRSPVLLILQDRPIPQPDGPEARHLRVTPIRVSDQAWAQHPHGVPGVLDDIAAGIITPPHRPERGDGGFGSEIRTLAVAVGYDDIHTDPHADTITPVRRVDAVDTDGRVYQVTRLPDERHGVAIVDDQPDPDDTPATHPGLHALLNILHRQPAA